MLLSKFDTIMRNLYANTLHKEAAHKIASRSIKRLSKGCYTQTVIKIGDIYQSKKDSAIRIKIISAHPPTDSYWAENTTGGGSYGIFVPEKTLMDDYTLVEQSNSSQNPGGLTCSCTMEIIMRTGCKCGGI